MSEFPGYVAWSGGRDSTAVVLLAHEVDRDVPVVWFDSGLEFPENRKYISEIADKHSLNLTILRTSPDALSVLRSSGVWDYSAEIDVAMTDLHDVLITRPAATAHSLFGQGELTGLRAEESVGRRALLAKNDGRYGRNDGTQVCAPVWSWSTNDVRAAIAGSGVAENPVYQKLEALGAPMRSQRVGLIVDGNNPDHGRYTYLRQGWPELWSELVLALPRLNEWR